LSAQGSSDGAGAMGHVDQLGAADSSSSSSSGFHSGCRPTQRFNPGLSCSITSFKRKLKRALPNGDPDRAGADGDPLRVEAQMDPFHECVRSWIDARHGSGSGIRCPDRSLTGGYVERVLCTLMTASGRRVAGLRRHTDLSSPMITQTEPKPVATAPGDGPAGISST
jgi:hypothetical protein